MLSIPRNSELADALVPLAQEHQQSVVDYAQQVLLEHISETQSIRIAEERWDRYLKGEEVSTQLAEAIADC